jgi:hypothetical protein
MEKKQLSKPQEIKLTKLQESLIRLHSQRAKLPFEFVKQQVEQ